MQQNPLAVLVLFLCVGPTLLTAFGFWLGRGGPLPGGRHFYIGMQRRRPTGYEDDIYPD